MAQPFISEALKEQLVAFFKKSRKPELVSSYLFFLEKKYDIHPVLFVRDKIIFQSGVEAVKRLGEEGKLWRETEIKIGFGPPTVNDQTKKIYICPFTGKVFADNTHPHPQDAIYDWVAKCPENTERVDGIKVKRFFVSEDPEIIAKYIVEHKKPVTKKVFSSVLSGKLYNSKEKILDDFKVGYLKPMTLIEVQNQNKYQIDDTFLAFIKAHLNEEKIAEFVEALSKVPELQDIATAWVEEEEEVG
jgi:hypothetical protein